MWEKSRVDQQRQAMQAIDKKRTIELSYHPPYYQKRGKF